MSCGVIASQTPIFTRQMERGSQNGNIPNCQVVSGAVAEGWSCCSLERPERRICLGRKSSPDPAVSSPGAGDTVDFVREACSAAGEGVPSRARAIREK